jgi:hypothetical protein
LEPFYEGNERPADVPVFDKRIAHAARDHGSCIKTLRNCPARLRSASLFDKIAGRPFFPDNGIFGNCPGFRKTESNFHTIDL